MITTQVKRRTAGVAAAALSAGFTLLFVTGVSADAGHSNTSGNIGHRTSGPGGRNSGDVWTDNVGQPAGPGHEQDPHLTCTDINIWGNGLADKGGTYTVDGWPPSGSREVDYSSTWAYATSRGGDQVISVINVRRLIATAIANGDAPRNAQGYHFKLELTQDPQKHKTFWVNCGSRPSPTPRPTESATPMPTETAKPTPRPSETAKPTATPTALAGPLSTPPPTTPLGGAGSSAPGSQPTGGVLGINTTTPATGAGIPAAPAAALIALGSALALVGRRRGRRLI